MKRSLLFLLFPLMACAQDKAPGGATGSTDQTVAQGVKADDQRRGLLAIHSDPRDEWQQPEKLLELMGDIEGIVIADLFAGDGYFTFKLIDAGARVIAIVNDVSNYETIMARKKSLGLGDDRLKVRAVPVGDPGLMPNEVDLGLIVHAFPGIKDKKGYLKLLRNGLRPPRALFMVEWQNRETPVGPPLAERMSPESIMDEFVGTGFTDLSARAKSMPYDVLYMMTDPMDEYMEGE